MGIITDDLLGAASEIAEQLESYDDKDIKKIILIVFIALNKPDILIDLEEFYNEASIK